MNKLLATLICLVTLPALAQFGTFSDQPFLAGDSGPCEDAIGPTDEFDEYLTDFVTLNGLNGGCLWNGAYVLHTYENVPSVWFQDPMDEYTDGNILDGIGGGVGWYSFYVTHSYESVPLTRYRDGFNQYADAESMITNTLALGTNYWATQITNMVMEITWNTNYVGKGY